MLAAPPTVPLVAVALILAVLVPLARADPVVEGEVGTVETVLTSALEEKMFMYAISK